MKMCHVTLLPGKAPILQPLQIVSDWRREALGFSALQYSKADSVNFISLNNVKESLKSVVISFTLEND